ncbi:hypothetical protein FB451DRAFT_1183151 [Mycena latifolia]|nr:hypothetical protein FB451DRAFT_1183151 [Mycena latifolia]
MHSPRCRRLTASKVGAAAIIAVAFDSGVNLRAGSSRFWIDRAVDEPHEALKESYLITRRRRSFIELRCVVNPTLWSNPTHGVEGVGPHSPAVHARCTAADANPISIEKGGREHQNYPVAELNLLPLARASISRRHTYSAARSLVHQELIYSLQVSGTSELGAVTPLTRGAGSCHWPPAQLASIIPMIALLDVKVL